MEPAFINSCHQLNSPPPPPPLPPPPSSPFNEGRVRRQFESSCLSPSTNKLSEPSKTEILPSPPKREQKIHPSPPPLPSNSGVATRAVSLLERGRGFSSSGHTARSDPSGQSSVDVDLQPGYFFFYRTLMDLEVLQTVLGLHELPALQKASVSGIKIKMWGIYLTLVLSVRDSSIVHGRFLNVTEVGEIMKLAQYETGAYKMVSVTIRAEVDGISIIIPEGKTFCWAGQEDCPDLEEGSFDLERYQRYFQSSVVRPAKG